MNTAQKIAKAEDVLAHARSLGFENAFLTFMDEEGIFYESLEQLSENYAIDESVSASIIITLDEDIGFYLIEDPDDENAAPRIDYTR